MNSNHRKDDFKTLSLEELQQLYEHDSYIPYHELLRVHQWQTRRLEILDRDEFYCQKCKGFKTKRDKSGKLVWGNPDMIIWIDSQGNARITDLNEPTYEPDKEYQIHIHHKRYIKNRLPWEYQNDDLVTLCHHCHQEEHKNNVIPVYDEFGRQVLISEPCDRCNGEGSIPYYQHVQGGICFKCRGLRINIILIDKKL